MHFLYEHQSVLSKHLSTSLSNWAMLIMFFSLGVKANIMDNCFDWSLLMLSVHGFSTYNREDNLWKCTFYLEQKVVIVEGIRKGYLCSFLKDVLLKTLNSI